MAEILLVNPKRRRKSRRKAKRSGTVSRRRTRRTKRVARRRRNPVAFINPKRRRRSAITRGFKKMRRRRRNPSLRGTVGSLKSSIVPTLKSGLVGAGGAIGLDLLWAQGSKFLPASIAGSPLAQYGAKLLGAVLVGMIGGKVLKGRGRDLAVGAATVVMHDALKAQLKASFPDLPLGEYLSFAPVVGSMRRAGPLLDSGLGVYLNGIPNSGSGGTSDDMNYTGEFNGDSMNGYG